MGCRLQIPCARVVIRDGFADTGPAYDTANR